MKTIIPVENADTLAALQSFLKQLLAAGVVDAVLTPMRTPSGTIAPALVTNPDLLVHADPLAPVMPVNSATLAGKLSVKEPRAQVAVVLRSCELRALVELTKMQQASLDNLTLVAVDCAGTYNLPDFLKESDRTNLWPDLFKAAESADSPAPGLRSACQMCREPVYAGETIHVELLGSDYSSGLTIDLPDELGARLGLETGTAPERRADVLESLVAARTAARQAGLTELRNRLEGADGQPGEGLTGVMAACIRCHNCMTVCPICYCKTCVFKSAVFDHEPMQLVHWSQQKGAYRLPSDTTLFHTTRLNHMSLSCVGCGMCTQACPAELPVGTLFQAVGERVQAVFEYTPGRSLEEPLPLITFKADEWTEVGE